MKVFISEQAKEWFKKEMEVDAGDTIRFYARYGGSSPLHDSFSLGMTKDTPFEPTVTVIHDKVMYFIEERDEWFFNGHDLYVTVHEELDELEYSYKKA